ncbi:DUF3105 domain-containing protein [Cohnella silvisoli]|uniref:DUF3105 domain-containing protein n=1 Tax=Cohnella silvisoli TaxID=2873699 RepID=A0ABV1L2D0_9BACL|nr:DUF3105 domain-containing protein [Cohnella silvisoli]MCD9025359.1 DUF3105 domain-containing protein [Cohnella silvisoli]
MIIGTLGGIILILAIVSYRYASKVNKGNTSQLKKDQKAALKKKSRKIRLAAHCMVVVSILLVFIAILPSLSNKYDMDTLNYNVPIEVTTDRDYGQGHSEMPIQYEMKIPTSGMHSPHDLKFGFYEEKPTNELLVHNLEHGDIVIYYRPDANATVKDAVDYLSHFTKAGSGVLAVPSNDIPEGKEVVLTAWTKTMALTVYDEKQAGTFIYQYINQGPEKIPPNIRLGGGTM